MDRFVTSRGHGKPRAGAKSATGCHNKASDSLTVSVSTALPTEVERPETNELPEPDMPWLVIVWNDPINLMSYVTYVLQKLFGYSRAKAHKLMLDVHYKGRAVVSSGPKERAELDVARLHQHGLWATMEHSS